MKDRDALYSSIKRLIFKYYLEPKDDKEYDSFIKELADLLNI